MAKTVESYIERATKELNAGFSTMADKKRCLEDVSRAYDIARHMITDGFLNLRNSGAMSEEEMTPLYYGTPYLLNHYRQKHSDLYRPYFPEAVKTIESLVELREQIKNTEIVKVASKASQAMKITEVHQHGQKIAEVVMPLKEAAVERAEKEAIALIEKCTKQLEKNGFDLNLVAPYPRTYTSAADYNHKIAIYALYSKLVRSVSKTGCRRDNEAHIVEMCPESVARFIKNSKIDAALQYDEFVIKLVSKIGEVDSASLHGNHVWSFSVLTVTKGAVTERWKTQMIVNCSKLGKLFNQFPTRKVK